VEAAAWTLKAACQRVAFCVSPCRLLQLPEELLLRMLGTLKSRDFAALACTCHTLGDGPLCSLIERGAQDALKRQYSTELAALPPQALRASARLRWLEGARKEAQSWLRHVAAERTPHPVIWPKSERFEEPPTAKWIEAVARFGGEGLDLSDRDLSLYTSNRQGDHADAGVRGALMCLVHMARRSGHVAREHYGSDYASWMGPYPSPTISKGAIS
jgi:hypothetical protein